MAHANPSLSRNRRLADALASQQNRIDELRLYAAIAVVFGHSWHIAGGPTARVPFQSWTVIGFHSLAVYVFFFLSGLLVTESAVRHAKRPLEFASKRMRRIMPALIVNALVIPLLLVGVGAWTGIGPAGIAQYSARLVSLFFVQYEHPGAFAANPFANALNGSVWSLRHEIIVYVLLFAAIVTGGLGAAWRRAGFLAVLIALVGAGALADPARGGIFFLLHEGHLAMFAFLLGVAAHQYSRAIPVNVMLFVPGLVLIAAYLIAGSYWSALRELGTVTIVCAATLFAAFPKGKGRRLSRDLSYGVYIYGWPIQQLVVFTFMRFGGAPPGPLGVFVVTMPPLLAVATLSWTYVEKPALVCKWHNLWKGSGVSTLQMQP